MIDQEQMPRSFLQRYAPALAALVVLAIIAASIYGTVLVLRREAVRPVAAIAMSDLPGPKNEISERTKYQIDTMSAQYAHIVGTLVIRYKYTKTQNMFLHYWAGTPEAQRVIDKIVSDLDKIQTPQFGKSSEEALLETERDARFAAKRLRNSEEARMGLIKCMPIDEAALVYTQLRTIATGICIATIPPFEANAKMSIIMLTDSKMTEFTELADMRRIMLALQIDIYNRDFKGRETWAHP